MAAAAASAAVEAATHLPSLSSVQSSVRSSLTSTLHRLRQETPPSLSSTLQLLQSEAPALHSLGSAVVQTTLHGIEGLAQRASHAVNHLAQQRDNAAAQDGAHSHKRGHGDGAQADVGAVRSAGRRRGRELTSAGEAGDAEKRRTRSAERATMDGDADVSMSDSEGRLSAPTSPPSSLPSPAASAQPSPTASPALRVAVPPSAPISPVHPRTPSPPIDVSVWPSLSPESLLSDLQLLLSVASPAAPQSLFSPLFAPSQSLFTLPLSSPYREYAELHAGYLEVARAMEEQLTEYTALYDALQADRSAAERERRAMEGEEDDTDEAAAPQDAVAARSGGRTADEDEPLRQTVGSIHG